MSDTSPIRALHHLNLLPVLTRLFGSVVIPRAVAAELRESRSRFRSIPPEALAFLEVADPLAVRLRDELGFFPQTR